MIYAGTKPKTRAGGITHTPLQVTTPNAARLGKSMQLNLSGVDVLTVTHALLRVLSDGDAPMRRREDAQLVFDAIQDARELGAL